MPNTLPEHIVLNREFSIALCTFKHQSRSVIYSPFTSESMLCDISVVTLLERLGDAGSHADEIDLFMSKHPQPAPGVIEQLLAMQILLPS
ncbi:hypothetical protein BIT28_23110 [Photobacterium proteolyticum]|uniref:Uncharacterized protein n=1 Tax=Photobacterium proteolyticum TaxID=1903952 RepID=A0A1Q9GLU6_9GAMM|nr:hypothetical protein [Photobacterium proteolyticum]OLQ75523.1 hypothetical protein BIT28_23110 [Photobacterium proteolyticum]